MPKVKKPVDPDAKRPNENGDLLFGKLLYQAGGVKEINLELRQMHFKEPRDKYRLKLRLKKYLSDYCKEAGIELEETKNGPNESD